MQPSPYPYEARIVAWLVAAQEQAVSRADLEAAIDEDYDVNGKHAVEVAERCGFIREDWHDFTFGIALTQRGMRWVIAKLVWKADL